MKLILGLGNPGTQYEKSRHNVGFMAVDRFAQKHGGGGGANFRAAHESFLCDILLTANNATEKIILLKPQTFMNLSGRAVASALAFYKLSIEDLLVVVDDLALPCGAIRIRPSGSAGGHNGLADIERALTNFAAAASAQTGRKILPIDYARLRIGIDPRGPVPQAAYVLEPFRKEQWPLVEQSLTRAAEAMATWATVGTEPAMNKFNAPPTTPTP